MELRGAPWWVIRLCTLKFTVDQQKSLPLLTQAANRNSDLPLKMRHMNITAARGLVTAASVSACKSSSWCNSCCNNTTSLHPLLISDKQLLILQTCSSGLLPCWFPLLWLWMEDVMRFTICLWHFLNRTCTPEHSSPVMNHPHPVNPNTAPKATPSGWL